MRKFSLKQIIVGAIILVVSGILLYLGQRIAEVLLATQIPSISDLTPLLDLITIGLIACGIAVVGYGTYRLKHEGKPMESQNQPAPSGLERLPKARIEVKDTIFTNQDVLLDGHTWEGCTFKKCNLVVETGDFALIRNHIDECVLAVNGLAYNVMYLAHLFFPEVPLKGDRPEYHSNIVQKDSSKG